MMNPPLSAAQAGYLGLCLAVFIPPVAYGCLSGGDRPVEPGKGGLVVYNLNYVTI